MIPGERYARDWHRPLDAEGLQARLPARTAAR
jgi:hypothetical protein